MVAKDALPVPSEEDECKALMRWVGAHLGRWPELRLFYHTANEGKRTPQQGARLKAMGLHAGVSDYFLPVPRGGMHGLWLEMKRRKGGHIEPEQAAWIGEMLGQGYAACVCRGWEDAARAIREYMTGGAVNEP